MSNPLLLSTVSKILGPDFLVDNTALSITWPGHNTFGPHRDRPFDGNSDHASSPKIDAQFLPPKSFPMSVQVVWNFDHFTGANGGFFFVPGSEQVPLGGAYADHVVPDDAQFVAATKGSALVANGQVLHGAGPNFSPRPRIALLVQYSRR